MTLHETRQRRAREQYFKAIQKDDGFEEIAVESIQSVKAQEEKLKEPQRQIKGNALLVLQAVARFPFKTITDIYSQVNLDGRKGKAALDELVKKGFVTTHDRAKKQVRGGGHPKIIELLKPARDLLDSLEIEMIKIPGRGSILHNVYAHDFGEFQRKKGCKEIFYDTRFETEEGTKDVDVSGIYLSGQVWVGEVFSSGSATHNTEALRRASMIKEALEVWGIFEDKKQMEAVAKILEKVQGQASLKKIKLMFVGDIYQD